MPIPGAMGSAIGINFQPTGDGKAAITGDFVALAAEVNPLIKALRDNGIEVTAIHNHMLDEEPRVFFVHFWANGDAVTLAKRLRAGLNAVHVAPNARGRSMKGAMMHAAWPASVFAFCLGGLCFRPSRSPRAGLALERTISLGKVAGRIDHLAVDLARKRLFVSELGDNSVAVVDIQSGRVIRQIKAFVSRRGSAIRPRPASSRFPTPRWQRAPVQGG